VGDLQAALERWGPKRVATSEPVPGSAAPTTRSEDLLDHSIIDELRDMPPSDGIGMLQELVDLFLESAPQRVAQISRSLADPTQLAFHAHALKSMSLNLGARRMVELSQRLEELGRAGSTDGASATIKELQSAFAETRVHLLGVLQR